MQMSGTSNVCRKLQLMLCARRCVIPHLGSPAGAWPPCTPHSWAGARSPQPDSPANKPAPEERCGRRKTPREGEGGWQWGGGTEQAWAECSPHTGLCCLQAWPSFLSLQYTAQGVLLVPHSPFSAPGGGEVRKGPVAAQCRHGSMTVVTAQTWHSGVAGPPAGGNECATFKPTVLGREPRRNTGNVEK